MRVSCWSSNTCLLPCTYIEFFFSVRDRESRDPPTYGTGETLNLTCSARATHSAMFSWRAPTIADSATQPPMKGEEGTTSTDDDMTFAAQIDLHVPGGQAQSGLYCCVGRSNVGSTTVDAEECLNITIVGEQEAALVMSWRSVMTYRTVYSVCR